MNSEYRKSWRCHFGIHDWQIIGYNSVLNPLPVEQCSRCGCGRQFEMTSGAEIRWTPEQMKAGEKQPQQ